MKVRKGPGLTFDDVLLVPQRSPVASRQDVDTASRFSRHITLHIPIVSSNMDTVTEGRMAIAMARAGGIGVVHRFLPVARQAAEVARVKRAESFVVEDPFTLPPDVTVGQARAALAERGIGGAVIVDGERRPAGIVTTRDLLFAPDAEQPVMSAMTPRDKLVTARQGISLEEAKKLLHEHRIEKLPLLDKDGRLTGLITSQDITKLARHPHATKDAKGRLRVAAAIGVHPNDLERARQLLTAGADALVIDIAHGHADHTIQTVRRLRKEVGDVELVAGNVATAEGVRDLADAGVDAIKVGVGAGSICITRIVAGSGVPQLTAIIECAEAARKYDVPTIADGGLRTSGDIVKALAAGAATVMLGSLLAGTEESPGATVIREGQKIKVTRGMASLGAAMSREAAGRGEDSATPSAATFDQDWEKVVPEGVEAVVPYRGAVAEVLQQLVGGLRSGMSYCGAQTIAEMQEKAEFIQMTAAGMRESGSHDVQRL
jgi:IMP dehydrogenase